MQGRPRRNKGKSVAVRLLSTIVLTVGAALLGGCADCPDCRADLVLGQDRRGMVEPALHATAAAFAAGAAPDGRAPPAALRLEIDPDALGPDSDTPHRLVRDRMAGLRLARPVPLAGGWDLEPSALLAVGESRYRLPQGMGILTDPVEIGFRTVSATPELALGRGMRVGDWDGRLSLGLGAQLARSRVTVRSDLLDVTHYATTRRGFLRLGTVLEAPGSRLGLAGEARIYEGRAAELAAEMRLRLR